MYSADDEMKEEKRKEEGEKRRILWLPRFPEKKRQILYDMASLFCRLITVGQHRQVELQTLFDYELFLHQSLTNMDV